MILGVFVFFFKQKTAYEMRISAWSSDVCSSDLWRRDWTAARRRERPPAGARWRGPWRPAGAARRKAGAAGAEEDPAARESAPPRRPADRSPTAACRQSSGHRPCCRKPSYAGRARSEEHTSELQSLMRNSYAVFCLKKKTQKP